MLCLLLALKSAVLADDGKYEKYQQILQIQNDSVKCARLIAYADKMADSLKDYNFALLVFEKANKLLLQKNYPSLQLELYYKWAFATYEKGNFAAADQLIVQALNCKIIESTPEYKAKVLNTGGAILQDLMVYKRALVYYNEALEIYTRLNNSAGKGRVYQNMANIFAMTGNYTQSDQFFDKSAEIFKKIGLIDNYRITIGNKAYVKWKLGKPDTAKILTIHSLDLYSGKLDVAAKHPERVLNLALMYATVKQWDSTFYYLELARHITDSTGFPQDFAGSYYYNMGYCYAEKGDQAKAASFYKKALRYKAGIANFRYLYENIAAAYLANKQYDSAFFYKNQALLLIDSIYKSELKEHITFENKRLELLEKDYQNQIQSAMQRQSLHELEKRNYLLIALVIVLGVGVLLFFLYFRQYKLKVKKEHLQSELDFLRAQLNPHFLFNSINNIYVLLDENKEKASHILLKFSELMRYQLYECNVSTIRLDKELQFLENYIEFEKLRYSNKIAVQYASAAADAERLLIAPLLLQPFIENAFKHTPKNKGQQSHIAIRIELEDNRLLFEVINTLDVRENSKLPGGIGLENVKKRLKLLYPHQHDLQIMVTDNSYKIILTLTLAHD